MAQQQPLAPLAAAVAPMRRGSSSSSVRGTRRREPLLLLLRLLFLLLQLLFVARCSMAATDHDSATQLFSHEFTLSQDQVSRGLAYVGDGTRIRSVMKALQAGRSIHLGVIGGSITWGHGASCVDTRVL